MPTTYDPNISPGSSSIVNNAIPGFNGMSGSATGIIGNLMGGMPSASPTKQANSYFGVNSGMPGSDFVRNRGFDLYGQQAQGNQQRGFDDFLKLLQGYSGTVMPTQGQQIQSSQFAQNLAFDQQKQAQSVAQQQAQMAMNNAQFNRLHPNNTGGYSIVGGPSGQTTSGSNSYPGGDQGGPIGISGMDNPDAIYTPAQSSNSSYDPVGGPAYDPVGGPAYDPVGGPAYDPFFGWPN